MECKYSNILVTGGAGFIGSHIVDRLISNGLEVTVIDNLSKGKVENISSYNDYDCFHFIRGDIRDMDLMENVVKEQDVIFHEAAFTSVPLSFEYPELTFDINVDATLAILKACLKYNVDRFVFASSAAVYGNIISLPITEENFIDPKSPYGISKLRAEKHIKSFCDNYGLKAVMLRYFNVFGPRARKNQGVISIFINNLLQDQKPVVYGDGEQTRDFVHVYDVAEANLLALSSDKAVGESINIGAGIPTSINKILNLISKELKKQEINIIYSEPRKGDIKYAYADITKAKELLNFNPELNVENSIKDIVKYYKTLYNNI